ncbi:Uncharacterised protein [Bordetella pertussis]|nr:Uncharacterised protein [Bordetella pertussis]CFO39244.1 Uncharacterised protein [Bordetella pertussis]CPJ24504.1 Uncharacterised protein [Bordetella pertussis]
MLPESTLGHTSRLASPLSVDDGRMRRRSASSNAQSPCISPSISSSGARSRTSSSARRILAPEAELPVPKFERDSSATLGARFRRRISSAAATVYSAICSALGSSLTCVSTSATVRSLSSRMFIAA